MSTIQRCLLHRFCIKNIKTSLILFLLFSFPVLTIGKANKSIVFNYHKPYKYFIENDFWRVEAFIKNVNAEQIQSVHFAGESISLVKKDGGLVAHLPLVGAPGLLTAKNSKGQVVVEQYYEPLVPTDWNYFKNGKIHVICSSHQDIAWMNTPDSCRHERVHDIVIPALDLIEKEPEFKFEMEQSLNLMEVLEDSPQDRQRIIDTYKSGNFEWGATLTQPYEGLESGEQLIRQTYFGRKWIKNNLPGMDALVAYNIDVPGRSLQVPQILNKAGIKYLFVTRMKEGFYNWHSPDGSKIFTYSPGNYGWALLVYKYLEEDAVTAMHKLHKVLQNWNEYYRERNLPPHYALIISTDAGGPKQYKDVINGWNEIAGKSLAEIPKIQHSTAMDFFHAVDVPEAKIDSIYGERPNLWLYIHGAGHYEAIKAKKAAAVSLPAAEKFNTISCLLENDFSEYPQKILDDAWFKAIYPDHGWGGKNGHITDSLFQVSLEQANEIGEKLLEVSLKRISDKVKLDKKNNIIVFNDLSWKRDGTATVDISHLKGRNWIAKNRNGEKVPSQVFETDESKQLVLYLADMPSIGYKSFRILKGESNSPDVKVGPNFCENQYYSVKLGRGGVTHLFDKELHKDVLNTTRMVGGDLFHMGYNGNGAGEFVQVTEPNYNGMERAHEKKSSWELVESGHVFSKFQSSYKMQNFSVNQSITVYHTKKQIDFDYNIPDWPGKQNRQVRVLFPLNVKQASQVSYDVPMGIVHVGKDELSAPPGGWAWGGTYRQMPKEIHPREIQNFMTVNGNELGVTMSTNLVTADWIDPSRESVNYPVLNAVLLSSHKSCHWQGNWYHQKGAHQFKFSITSHKSGRKNGFHFGVENNHPFRTVLRDKQKGSLPTEKSFVSTSNPFAVISTIKKADDDENVVIRFMEAERKDNVVQVTLDWPIETLYQTDLIEENPVRHAAKEKYFEFKLGKSSIQTFKVKPNK